LRQIGLALLVSRKHQLPLFHKTYEGNKNDYTVFSETLNELSSRIKTITAELKDVTLVFDKGNNSKDNFRKLASQKLWFSCISSGLQNTPDDGLSLFPSGLRI